MNIPNDPHDKDFRATLPVDLQALDRELSGIRIEERPSFAPELKGELAQAWQDRFSDRSKARRPWVRTLLAACLAGLMIASVSVPSARAAVFELVRTVAEEAFPGLFAAPEPEAEVVLPEIQVQEPEPVQPEPRTEVVVSPVDASEEVETSAPDLPTIPAVEITFPEIISRQEAARVIASHYPLELQEAGVEGAVKLQFWVDNQGRTENIQIRDGGSGNLRLDYAAMRAAREIRFNPATRNGVAVGTWVEVEVHFFALTGVGVIGTGSGNGGS